MNFEDGLDRAHRYFKFLAVAGVILGGSSGAGALFMILAHLSTEEFQPGHVLNLILIAFGCAIPAVLWFLFFDNLARIVRLLRSWALDRAELTKRLRTSIRVLVWLFWLNVVLVAGGALYLLFFGHGPGSAGLFTWSVWGEWLWSMFLPYGNGVVALMLALFLMVILRLLEERAVLEGELRAFRAAAKLERASPGPVNRPE